MTGITDRDLVARLQIKAGMLAMGERIAFGSEVEVMKEAADAIERLLKERDEAIERLIAIIDWADLALSRPEDFNASGVRNLDGPIFDKARSILSKYEVKNDSN